MGGSRCSGARAAVARGHSAALILVSAAPRPRSRGWATRRAGENRKRQPQCVALDRDGGGWGRGGVGVLSGRTLPEAVAPDGRPTAPPATSLRPQRRRRPTPAAGSAAPAAFMSPCADRARPLRLWAMAPRRACGRCRADRHDTEAAPASTAARGDGGAAGRTKHGSARGRRTGHRQRRGSLLRSPSAHAPESSTPWLHRRCGGGGVAGSSDDVGRRSGCPGMGGRMEGQRA